MSIQQYYHKTAQSYLYAFVLAITVYTAVLAVGLLLPSRPPLGLIFFPFFAFSLIQYFGYLRFKKLSKEVLFGIQGSIGNQFFSYSDYLLMSAPAPALKLLLFHPNSLLVGEIKEIHQNIWRYLMPDMLDKFLTKTYGLYDSSGTLLAMFIANNQRIEVLSLEWNVECIYEVKDKAGFIFDTGVELRRQKHSSISTDVRMVSGVREVSKLQKGWMPTEWNHRFDVNTPILSFDLSANHSDKLLTFASIISDFQYKDH
ncbi:hypothetical protein M3181_05095 [Mesobacillus maritimus]|uniref:hypothetical protein n=1 Tax=Mesobacillus maritimus TaxID=1643336 RepID=UPI00203C823E|nr:hypothetical protein [Mesobacillus maritimus]MCM3668378.1 hypothetical protein [Mesobacillus maritimus]